MTVHDRERAQPGFNFYTSGHAPEATLMDMEGNQLHRWHFEYRDAFPDSIWVDHPNTEWWRRVYLYPNGDVLAIFEGFALVKVDKESVRDATRTLLSNWNLPGMSDDFVDSVANSFAAGQKVAAQNAIGNPFNPEFQGAFGPTQRVVDNPIDKAAHAKKAIRGSAAYQKYFANKGDLTEEEYVNRFESEANRMLGRPMRSPWKLC